MHQSTGSHESDRRKFNQQQQLSNLFDGTAPDICTGTQADVSFIGSAIAKMTVFYCGLSKLKLRAPFSPLLGKQFENPPAELNTTEGGSPFECRLSIPIKCCSLAVAIATQRKIIIKTSDDNTPTRVFLSIPVRR